MRFIRPGLSIAVLFLLCASSRASTDVRVSAPESPAILAGAELPDEIQALAVSADGSRLAYALAASKAGFSDLFRVDAAVAEPSSVTLPGTIRDLVFLDDDRTLVGLQHRPAKKREGDTFLFTWAEEPKTRRIMRLPPSSQDLDRWPGGNALVLACRNEIRTILLPDFRSGPLFGFPGDNFAVTSLGRSTYVVVGQEQGLYLLDLSVPSGRESMPVLAEQRVPSRVAALADYPAGDEVLVRLVDGRLFRASFDPRGFEPAGTADRIVGLRKAASGPVLPFRARVEEAPVEPSVQPLEAIVIEPVKVDVVQPIPTPEIPQPEPAATEPSPAPISDARAEPQVTPSEPIQPAPEETAARVDPPSERDEPPMHPEEVPEEAPQNAPVEADLPPEDEAEEEVAAVHQIEGRIVGDVALVQDIVLLGPDNILREAARVQPKSDGTWHADGLDAGRYRVQLDGGGDRVLVAEPRFLMVEIGKVPTRAPEIKAVRSF